jgi:hypothetical protein
MAIKSNTSEKYERWKVEHANPLRTLSNIGADRPGMATLRAAGANGMSVVPLKKPQENDRNAIQDDESEPRMTQMHADDGRAGRRRTTKYTKTDG